MLNKPTTVLSPADFESIADGLFFVVGNSRGGTTLLQSVLSAHSRITIPPETHYFANLNSVKKRCGKVIDESNLNQVLAYLQRPNGRMVDFGLPTSEVLANYRAVGANWDDLFVIYLGLYAQQRQKPRCGEKTPRHLLHVPYLAERFPNAKFLALFRDPRSVAASELRAAFGSPSVVVSARRWRRYANLHERLQKQMGAHRYLMVRYEDLVGDPGGTVEAICAFLEEAFEGDMLAFHTQKNREKVYPEWETWKGNTARPIQGDRATSWQRELSAPQIALVERTVGPALKAMGYAKAEGVQVGRLSLHRHWVRDVGASVLATALRSRKKATKAGRRTSG